MYGFFLQSIFIMAINKNLVVLGVGGVAIVGMLVWKQRKSACNQSESCSKSFNAAENGDIKTVEVTDEEYAQILSPDVLAAFNIIAEAAETSNEEAIEKVISNQGVIDDFTHSVASFIKTKIDGVESKEEIKKIELDIFNQVCDRVKYEIGSSVKKDEFFTAYFHGLKEKTLIEERA